MMGSWYERQSLGSSPGVRHGTGEPGTASAERISGGGELAHLQARLRLSDPERRTLAEIGKRLGRKVLQKQRTRWRGHTGEELNLPSVSRIRAFFVTHIEPYQSLPGEFLKSVS